MKQKGKIQETTVLFTFLRNARLKVIRLPSRSVIWIRMIIFPKVPHHRDDSIIGQIIKCVTKELNSNAKPNSSVKTSPSSSLTEKKKVPAARTNIVKIKTIPKFIT